jgi:hypothetical protein
MLANFSNEPLSIPNAGILGVAEGVSGALIDKINAKAESSANTPTKPLGKTKINNLYDKLLLGKLNLMTPEDREHIEPVLRK